MSKTGMSNPIESIEIETRKANAMSGTSVIDCTKLTVEQANKIEMVLLSLQSDVYDHIIAYEKLSADTDLTKETREKMYSNMEWWLAAYQLIYEKREM